MPIGARDAHLLIDGAIVCAYFLMITGIGLYLGRRDRSLNDFALAGRRVPWWAVMASIIAAETSAATFLGVPGEGYTTRSFAYVQIIVGLILGRVVVGHVFLEPYYRFRVYTVYDYLGVRFVPLSRAYVSALFLFMRTLASGTRLFIPSLVMVLAYRLFVGGDQARFGPEGVTTVGPYLVAIVALTVVTCLYTAVGGIKAVIWTDVIQACLMFGGALVAIGTLLAHVGGLHAVFQAVPELTTHEGYFLHGIEAARVAQWMPSDRPAQPHHRRVHGSSGGAGVRVHRHPPLRLLPAGSDPPPDRHRRRLRLLHPERHAGGRARLRGGRGLRHRDGLVLRRP